MNLLKICTVALLFVALKGAYACSCAMSGSPCEQRLHAGPMFVALVQEMRVVGNERTLADGRRISGGGRRIYTASVEEDFSGTRHRGETIEIDTGMGGGDCGYSFTLGKRYLIDPYLHDGKVSVSICGRTKPETAAGVELRELRDRAGSFAALRGSVIHYAADYGARSSLPVGIPDVPVVVTSTDGITRSFSTGSDGVYEVQSLAPGTYTVAVSLGRGLTRRDGEDKLQRIVIPPNMHSDQVCHLELQVFGAGRLEGRVVDASGVGMEGSLTVYDHAPAVGPIVSWSAFGTTLADGTFNVGPLDGGPYWLYFTPKLKSQKGWFYPGVQDPAASEPIHVDEGKAITGVRFVLQPQ